MSRIDDLLSTHCPDGVEFRALGEVGEFIRGNGLQKSDLTSEGSPAIHYGQLHTHYGVWADTTKSFTDPSLAARLRRARPGDLIIVTTSEDINAVAKATAWMGRGEVAVSGDAYIFRHSLDPRFVAYFFQARAFQEQKWRYITGTKLRRISGSALGQIRIPVPPLAVQREIVAILDHFSKFEAELAAALEAEREARRRQYGFYRDSLLAFVGSDDARWVSIGDLGEIFRGKRFTKADYVAEGGIGVIHYGEIYTRYGTATTQVVSRVRSDLKSTLRYARTGDLVLTDVGETVEAVGKAVAWLGHEDVAVHDHCYVIRSDVSAAYLSYVMQTATFSRAKEQHIARTKVKTLLLDGLKRILVPVPSAMEQARVVGLLDQFDALVNDLSLGLPAELAARRQQYEHYRDRLLTFTEASA